MNSLRLPHRCQRAAVTARLPVIGSFFQILLATLATVLLSYTNYSVPRNLVTIKKLLKGSSASIPAVHLIRSMLVRDRMFREMRCDIHVIPHVVTRRLLSQQALTFYEICMKQIKSVVVG